MRLPPPPQYDVPKMVVHHHSQNADPLPDYRCPNSKDKGCYFWCCKCAAEPPFFTLPRNIRIILR